MRGELHRKGDEAAEPAGARCAVAVEDPQRFVCSLTGAPAVDAVRLRATGKVAMEKAAVVRGLDHDPDPETRRAFEERVEACREEVVLRREDCLPWYRRMPKNGMVPFE